MDFNKAINVLGLSKNFTEEELKKSYKKLIKQYHPDFYENKSAKEKELAKKKASEINIARDYLENYLNQKKNTTSYQTQTSSESSGYNNEVDNVKQELKKQIEEMINELYSININNDDELKVAREKILSKLNSYNVDSVVSIMEIHAIKIGIQLKITEILIWYKDEYVKKHNIVVNNGEIKKTYSLKNLYNKLEEIRKYQELITKRIEEGFQKYTYYAGFNIIEKTLLKIKREILLSLKSELLTIETAIISLNSGILKEFENYYQRLSELNLIKEELKESEDRILQILIGNLEKVLNDDDSFYEKLEEINCYRIIKKSRELNTGKIQAPREVGYDKIDERNASEVLDKIVGNNNIIQKDYIKEKEYKKYTKIKGGK